MPEQLRHDQIGPPRRGRAELKTGGLLFLAATFLGLFFSAQLYFSAASLRHPVSWGQAMYWGFGDWYEWACLSPAIFWWCRRYRLERSRWPKTLFVYLAGGLVLAAVHAMMCAGAEVLQGWVAGPSMTFAAALRRLLASRTPYNLAVYAGVVCAWHAWDYHRALRERETQAAELAGRLAQTQLELLRTRLNPHFLCNTLNAVSCLMLTDVRAANRMLSRLGDLLRQVLDNTARQEVSLGEEIEFLRRYVEIEQIRFGPRLELRLEVDPSTLDAAVPSLILQPLVENAIRHAIEPRNTPGHIELRSARDHDRLVVRISDDGPGWPSAQSTPAKNRDDRRERIGLSNTRERLRVLYRDEQRLDLTGNPEGGVTVNLEIPFRLAPAPAAL